MLGVFCGDWRRSSGPASSHLNGAHKGGAWISSGASVVSLWNQKEEEAAKESDLDFPWLQKARFYNLGACCQWLKSGGMTPDLWINKGINI